MVSEKKVREMQRIVANYQNNVQDLTLDKERLGFELEHAQSLQRNYLSDLDVERASVAALRRQVVDMKDGFRGIARDNLREIEGEIADKAHGREAHRHEELEKSEKSFRGHRKIFEGEVRVSRASNQREANLQK